MILVIRILSVGFSGLLSDLLQKFFSFPERHSDIVGSIPLWDCPLWEIPSESCHFSNSLLRRKAAYTSFLNNSTKWSCSTDMITGSQMRIIENSTGSRKKEDSLQHPPLAEITDFRSTEYKPDSNSRQLWVTFKFRFYLLCWHLTEIETLVLI